MNILIVGFGNIARRHAANLRRLAPTAKIAALRRAKTNLEDAAGLLDDQLTTRAQAEAFRPTLALVCTPASDHIETTRWLLGVGCDVLVEKPLSSSLDGIDELMRTAHQSSALCMVAYPFRFDATLLEIKDLLHQGAVGRVVSARAEVGMYLPDWRPRDYRQTPSAHAALGGGALLELSHEIDTVRWLLGEPTRVLSVVRKVSDLELDVDDMAELLLDLENDAIVSVHLDMVQRVPYRALRIVGTEGTVEWTMEGSAARLFRASTGAWEPIGGHAERNDMYLDQLRAFLSCCKERTHPICDLAEGKRTLHVALSARRSSSKGWVDL